MSKLPSSANEAQLIEILNSMARPLVGAGGGFAPLATEAYIEGTEAPDGWILCDGGVHNIKDYPELAAYYASHYGKSNYFGGDGVTTFAVPVKEGMPNNTDSVYGEQERVIGIWKETVDGVLKQKPVYGKIINVTTTTSEYSINVSKLNIERVAKLRRMIHQGNGGTWEDGNYYENTGSSAFCFYNPSTQRILCRSGSLYGYGQCALEFEYTKTTDSWTLPTPGHSADGLGVFCVKATVAGDPNAHVYSTDEQVVATWIDGRPVYERTINFVFPTTNNSYKTMATFTDVDKIIDICQASSTATDNNEYIVTYSIYYKYDKSNGNLSIACTAVGSLAGKQACAVVRYVKTAS